MKEGETHRRNLKEETQREMERKFKKKTPLQSNYILSVCKVCVYLCISERAREPYSHM